MQNIIILASILFNGYVANGIGGFVLAVMAWFFSTRRSLFLKVFTAYDEDRDEADKNLPKDVLFKKVSRGFAVVFLIYAIVFIALAVFL